MVFTRELLFFAALISQSALLYTVLVNDSWGRRTNTSHAFLLCKEWGPGNEGVYHTYRPPAGSQCSHSEFGLLLPFFLN